MALGTFIFTGPLTQTVTVNTFTLYNYPNPRDYFYVFLGKPTVWASLTIPTAGVTTGTDTFAYTAHGLVAGDQVVYYHGGGSAATGLTTATDYYVIASGLTADAFKVSATSGGSAVNITGTGNNAQYFEKYASVAATGASALGTGARFGGLPHIGWVKRQVLTGQNSGRIRYETLVALSKNAMTSDATDDIQFPD